MDFSNPDPYLNFLDAQKREGKSLFQPWSTTDISLLKLVAEFFPEIPLVSCHDLVKPDTTSVEILPLDRTKFVLDNEKDLFIAVGGPPAATVALQAALNKKNVLYICDSSSRPIWAGAGNHGEPDALTEAPAYTAGYQPLKFIVQEWLRFLRLTPRSDVATSTYPWLSLNITEWLKNPHQWIAGLKTAWGNHRLYQAFKHSVKTNKVPAILQKMRERTHISGKYLHELNQFLQDGLIRSPRGSLLIAYTVKEWSNLLRNQIALNKEGLTLKSLSPEEVESRYGILPRHAVGFLEKSHDFIFKPDFYQKLLTAIKAQGGAVITHWRLMKIWIDITSPHAGIMEFLDITDKSIHYKQFTQAHLSLGATLYKPNSYDLISVTGVSMNVLLIGAALTGGPIVCGGTNHVVPLSEPRKIPFTDPQTGKIELRDVTLVRLSAAACVSPLDRGQDWHTYEGRHAMHLLHRVRETLPSNIEIRVLSAYGCNRVIGKDGHQVEIHPIIQGETCNNITLQMGAGGGGLTQMGYIPQLMKTHFL